MSESNSGGHASGAPKASAMISFGGMLGVAACSIGIAIFLGGCMGFDAVFRLSIIPLAMSGVGMAVSVLGGILRRGGVEHTGILAGVFINLFALVGGLLELAVAQDWAIFPHAAG